MAFNRFFNELQQEFDNLGLSECFQALIRLLSAILHIKCGNMTSASQLLCLDEGLLGKFFTRLDRDDLCNLLFHCAQTQTIAKILRYETKAVLDNNLHR